MKKLLLLLLLVSLPGYGNDVPKDTISVQSPAIESTESLSTRIFKQTDEVLAIAFQKALAVAEKTGEFAIEQAPLLLQEFYTWHIAKNVFMMLIYLGIVLLSFRVKYICSLKTLGDGDNKKDFKLVNGRYYCKDDDDFLPGYAAELTLKGFCWLFMIGVLCRLYDLVYIIAAPKLYLIDYFLEYMK